MKWKRPTARQFFKFMLILLPCAIIAMVFFIHSQSGRKIFGYTVYGIDVSKWQGKIDWQSVSADGISFALIKASEGHDNPDEAFLVNWANAKHAGLLCGAYHYYRPEASARAQLELFKSLAPLERGDLPPVIDVEEHPGKQKAQFIKNLKALLDSCESFYGTKPIIYTSSRYYEAHLGSEFDQYPIWVAHYGRIFTLSPRVSRAWQFWQYSETGRVAGIKGAVDLNTFNGNMFELNLLTLQHAP